MQETESYTEISNSCCKDRLSLINKIILDASVSLKAKGLFSLLMFLPTYNVINRTELIKHVSDGKDSLKTAFTELESKGYIKSTEVKKDGQFQGYKLSVRI
ncbi:MAG: hypothetical protein JWR05_3516 [Mucilaginibacter sp.]|nr:hypothetical protein [Mucilaginibacter sp.]